MEVSAVSFRLFCGNFQKTPHNGSTHQSTHSTPRRPLLCSSSSPSSSSPSSSSIRCAAPCHRPSRNVPSRYLYLTSRCLFSPHRSCVCRRPAPRRCAPRRRAPRRRAPRRRAPRRRAPRRRAPERLNASEHTNLTHLAGASVLVVVALVVVHQVRRAAPSPIPERAISLPVTNISLSLLSPSVVCLSPSCSSPLRSHRCAPRRRAPRRRVCVM